MSSKVKLYLSLSEKSVRFYSLLIANHLKLGMWSIEQQKTLEAEEDKQ